MRPVNVVSPRDSEQAAKRAAQVGGCLARRHFLTPPVACVFACVVVTQASRFFFWQNQQRGRNPTKIRSSLSSSYTCHSIRHRHRCRACEAA
jgi:hypothetical protein